MGICSSIKMWVTAFLFGFMISLHLLWQCVTKGFFKVLHWKVWDKPSCLIDPSLGTHGFLTLKDVTIHYVANGSENKPLMLFVHGFPEFWYSWRHQLKEFKKDYRVVAIDQRGYSESSKPSGIQNYTMAHLMSDLEQVIEALGYKSCVLVAHDWGGIVAWAFARNYPELVDRIIVMNAPPYPVLEYLVKNDREQAKKSWYMTFFQVPYLPELLLKCSNFAVFDDMVAKKKSGLPESSSENADNASVETINAYKYAMSQPGALTPPLNYYRALFRHRSAANGYEYDMEFSMPALLIWGCKDPALDIAIPNFIEKMVPSIDVVKLPDAAHGVQNESPEEVNKILKEWLRKHK